MVNGKEFIKSLFVVPTLSTRRKGKKNERELVIKVVQPNRAEVEEIYLTERLVARVEENIEYSNNEYLNSFFGKEYFWLSIYGFGLKEEENIFGRPKKHSSLRYSTEEQAQKAVVMIADAWNRGEKSVTVSDNFSD